MADFDLQLFRAAPRKPTGGKAMNAPKKPQPLTALDLANIYESTKKLRADELDKQNRDCGLDIYLGSWLIGYAKRQNRSIISLLGHIDALRTTLARLSEPDEAQARAYAESRYYANKTPLRPVDENALKHLRDCSTEDFIAGWKAALAAAQKGEGSE